MKRTLLAGLLLLSVQTMAEHSLGAHVHGALKMDIAVEKNTADIDLDGPAESFLGFEYLPKSDKDKKTFEKAKTLWEKDLLTVVSFNKTLGCKVAEASFQQIAESGSHSDIEAKAKVTCAKNLSGSEIQISLIKTFGHIKKLKIDVLSSETRSVEITKPVATVRI